LIILVSVFALCRICSEELLVEGEDMLMQLFYNKFV